MDEHKKLNICSTLLAGVQSKYTNMATAPSSGEAGKEHKDSVKIQNREKERKRKKERKKEQEEQEEKCSSDNNCLFSSFSHEQKESFSVH